MSELNLTTEVFAQHESGRIVYAVVDDNGKTRAYMIDGRDDTLINRKAELRGKLESFETNRRNRFEPAIGFVLAAKQATDLLAEGNSEKNRDFLKKAGSNFQVAGQTLTVSFKNPWQFVVNFNSTRSTTPASAGEFCETSRWRRGRDSNPR